MKPMVRSTVVAVAVALALGSAAAAAQSAQVTSNDLERLQYALEDARRDVNELRARNATASDRLQARLEELNEDVIYLKVRLRRERTVPRSEYSELRDRIDDLRNEARTASAPGGRTPSADTRAPESRGTTAPRRSAANEIPVGQELDVRLSAGLNSGTAQIEDRFEATTLVDLVQDERVLVPAGSVLRGVVTAVDPASRTDRKGSLTLAFDQITVNGKSHPIRATVTQALESEGIKGETGRIATGAGVGAIIGGILGGFKGALAGILIGGGGTVVATEGKNVDLPAGTVLRVRFDAPVTIR